MHILLLEREEGAALGLLVGGCGQSVAAGSGSGGARAQAIQPPRHLRVVVRLKKELRAAAQSNNRNYTF